MHDVGLQFGLIAEKVAAVNPDLVVRDKNGEIYIVRYDALNAMLRNQFLKQRRKGEQQEGKIQQQGYKLQEQEAMITAKEGIASDSRSSAKAD